MQIIDLILKIIVLVILIYIAIDNHKMMKKEKEKLAEMTKLRKEIEGATNYWLDR